jgi:hypothetical protein
MSNIRPNLPPYDPYDSETYPLANLEQSIVDHIRVAAPTPYSVPIGYERSQNRSNARPQSTTSNAVSTASSSQIKPGPSGTAERVDSVIQLSPATNDEDDIRDPLDSEPVPITETRGWKIPLILYPHMTNEELETFWNPPNYVGNVRFFKGGPNVPSENSREVYDLVVCEPDQLFDPDANPAVRPASSLDAPFLYRPMDPSQLLLEAQRLLEEQQREAERVREEERLREEAERLKEEEDLQITRAQERLQRMDREELNLRYKLPETREERRYCADKHNEMLFERGLHVCEESPCFDNACTIGLPGRTGCRYAKAFHSTPSTSPCVWGWGLMLKEYEIEFGSAAAKFTQLDEVTEWYRQRREHDRRFEGPVLVKDPPYPLPGQQYYWVVRPW